MIFPAFRINKHAAMKHTLIISLPLNANPEKMRYLPNKYSLRCSLACHKVISIAACLVSNLSFFFNWNDSNKYNNNNQKLVF